MLSETLRQRPLFNEQREARIKAPAIIDKAARNLVQTMRMYELFEAMSMERIEEYVLRSLENAERMYYGLDADSLKTIVEMEIRNDEGRTRHTDRA